MAGAGAQTVAGSGRATLSTPAAAGSVMLAESVTGIVTTENVADVTGSFSEIASTSAGLADGTRLDLIYGGNAIDVVVTPETFLSLTQGYGITDAIGVSANLGFDWAGDKITRHVAVGLTIRW